jgi:hypothetical protein
MIAMKVCVNIKVRCFAESNIRAKNCLPNWVAQGNDKPPRSHTQRDNRHP